MTAPIRRFADLVDQARRVRIEDEIARRNIRLRGNIDRCGPCPACGGRDRFAINVRKQCFICRGGYVIAMVQHLDGATFARAVETLTGEKRPPPRATPAPAKAKGNEEYEREQHRKAAWLWQRQRPVASTIAETYLRARGITCPLPATLGYLAPTKPGYHPALISAFDFPEEIEPGRLATTPHVDAVHLTLLRRDGSDKADVDPNK
jgi:hypothetical protein